jgi:hypothetical protein
MPYQRIVKIDPATMTEVARWTGVLGQVLDVSGSDNGLFAGLDTPDVVNIDADTMEEAARWTGSPGEIPEKVARVVTGG